MIQDIANTVQPLCSSFSRGVLLSLQVFVLLTGTGQTEDVPRPQLPVAPKLQQVLDESFLADSRGNYQVQGDVAWKRGELEVGPGARIGVAVECGGWLTTQLQVGPSDGLTAFDLILRFDGATDLHVRLSREQDGVSVAILGTEQESSRKITVRQTKLKVLPEAPLAVHYRFGLVDIIAGEKRVLTGYVPNRDTPVTTVLLAAQSNVRVRHWAIHATELSSAEATQQQLEEVGRLALEVNQLQRAGQVQQVVKKSAQLVDLVARVKGLDNWDYLAALSNYAVHLGDSGQPKEATGIYKIVIESTERSCGKRHPELATCLNNRAKLLSRFNLALAEQEIRRAIAIREDSQGTNSVGYADNLQNLAVMLNEQGRLFESRDIYRQVEPVFLKAYGKDSPRNISLKNNMALNAKLRGDLTEAVDGYKDVLRLAGAVLPPQHPLRATLRSNLANALSEAGHSSLALDHYLKAVELTKSTHGDTHWRVGRMLNGMAVLYRNAGRFAESLETYREALDILRKSGEGGQVAYAEVLANRALLYWEFGDLRAALNDLNDALTITRRVGPAARRQELTILQDRASLMADAGDQEAARQEFSDALAKRAEFKLFNPAAMAGLLFNIAEIDDRLGRRDEAKAGFQKALKLLDDAGRTTDPLKLQIMQVLAVMEGERGNVDQLLEVQRIRRETYPAGHPHIVAGQSELARLYRWRGEFTKARQLSESALDSARRRLDDTALLLSERQQLGMARGYRARLDRHLSLAVDAGLPAADVFKHVLQWKGAVLMRQRRVREMASTGEVSESFAELRRTASRLSFLTNLEPPQLAAEKDRWKAQLQDTMRRKAELEETLAERSARYDLNQSVSVDDVCMALPDDSVLLDYIEFTQHLPPPKGETLWSETRSMIAFVVEPGGAVTMIPLGELAGIEAAIADWRKSFGAGPKGQAAGRILRDRIWEPVRQHVAGRDTVLVSVDGQLARLPLNAMPGDQPGTWLIEQVRLAMIPVPQLLPELRPVGGRNNPASLLLFGDVDYDAGRVANDVDGKSTEEPLSAVDTLLAARGREFNSLPSTGPEIDQVRRIFQAAFDDPTPDKSQSNRVQQLRGDAATESAFREAASNYQFVHLATHGFFSAPSVASAMAGTSTVTSTAPDSSTASARGFSPYVMSGVALAGANQSPVSELDDGILTAEEIAFLPLNDVEMVVLSACETGLGDVAGGEGTLGLQRAMQISGVRTTVTSLWSVSDQATRELMIEFYANLWGKKMSRLDAFRAAQIALLRDPSRLRGSSDDDKRRGGSRTPVRSDRSHAYYWAGFVLSGGWAE